MLDKTESKSPVSSATPMEGLSQDVLMKILAPLPRSKWFQLRNVCRAWKNAIEDPYFHQIRVDLGCTEEWCYTEAWDPATRISSWYAFDYGEKKWFALPPIPKKRNCGHGIYGRASTSWQGELYVVGGKAGESGITLRDMYIYSPVTNRWRKCRQNMINTRHSPFMYAFGGRIYVVGGFDCQDNHVKHAEYYDVGTQRWTYMNNVNYPEVICPSDHHVGWQVLWTALQSQKGGLYVSFRKTREAPLSLIRFDQDAEEWFPSEFRDKAKVLLTYSLAGVVNKRCVMLDWPSGMLRCTAPYPIRKVVWLEVRGMKDLNWASILQKNPKVSYHGSKFVIVNRGMTVLMIETHEDLLQRDDEQHVQEFKFSRDGPKLEPLKCVVVDA